MQAIIMAGGRGSRLMPLTKDTPKPMVKLIDRPVMQYVVESLKKYNFCDIAVTLGYLPEKIVEYFGDGRQFGVTIRYFYEDSPLGTAGGVKNCSPFLKDEDFLVLSADGYSEIDLGKLWRFHRKKRSIFTLACQKIDHPIGLGVLEKEKSGLIRAFLEKPVGLETGIVNTGIYAVNRRVLDMIPEGFFDFGKDLLPALTGIAYAYEDDGYWSDIGTLKSYYETNKILAEQLAFA